MTTPHYAAAISNNAYFCLADIPRATLLRPCVLPTHTLSTWDVLGCGLDRRSSYGCSPFVILPPLRSRLTPQAIWTDGGCGGYYATPQVTIADASGLHPYPHNLLRFLPHLPGYEPTALHALHHTYLPTTAFPRRPHTRLPHYPTTTRYVV